jgi:hypothetical protein
MKADDKIPITSKKEKAFDKKFISPQALAERWDLSLSCPGPVSGLLTTACNNNISHGPPSELWKRTHRTNCRLARLLSASERSTALKMYDNFVAASPDPQSCVRSDVNDWPVTAHAGRCAFLKNTSRNIWRELSKG